MNVADAIASTNLVFMVVGTILGIIWAAIWMAEDDGYVPPVRRPIGMSSLVFLGLAFIGLLVLIWFQVLTGITVTHR